MKQNRIHVTIISLTTLIVTLHANKRIFNEILFYFFSPFYVQKNIKIMRCNNSEDMYNKQCRLPVMLYRLGISGVSVKKRFIRPTIATQNCVVYVPVYLSKKQDFNCNCNLLKETIELENDETSLCTPFQFIFISFIK